MNSLVLAYNNTQHRGLKGKTPSHAHELTDPKAWRQQFRLMYKMHRKKKIAFLSDLKVGNLVRVVSSNRSQRFDTGYIIQNAEEIFCIIRRYHNISGLPSYGFGDWGREPINGIFYRD